MLIWPTERFCWKPSTSGNTCQRHNQANWDFLGLSHSSELFATGPPAASPLIRARDGNPANDTKVQSR
jgi:hypothetical protein